MFFLLFAITIFMIGVICFVLSSKAEEKISSEFSEFCLMWAILSCLVSILVIGVGIVVNLYAYSSQVYSFENLKMIKANEKIYADKAEALTREFAGYLAEAYPDFEKSVFDKISPEGIDVYLVKYPELKSSETITLLVQEISQMQGARYNQRLVLQQELRDIRYRCKSPWLFFIPDPDPAWESAE